MSQKCPVVPFELGNRFQLFEPFHKRLRYLSSLTYQLRASHMKYSIFRLCDGCEVAREKKLLAKRIVSRKTRAAELSMRIIVLLKR